MKKLLSSVFILITFATLATNALANSPSTTSSLVANAQPTFPIRAAFYYPWFPEAWKQQGIYPYTRFTPSLNYYDLSDQATIRKHIDAMQYGNIDAGIVSWWGPGTRSDSRVPTILSASSGNPFRWGFYHEQESQGDPSVASIQADLTYLRELLWQQPQRAARRWTLRGVRVFRWQRRLWNGGPLETCQHRRRLCRTQGVCGLQELRQPTG